MKLHVSTTYLYTKLALYWVLCTATCNRTAFFSVLCLASSSANDAATETKVLFFELNVHHLILWPH